MNNPSRPRGFEDRLLNELKNYVSERNKTMNSAEDVPVKGPRIGRAAKISLAGAVGAVALGVGAVVAVPTLTASPAYAVEPTDDGKVHIDIRAAEDAEGLEETLAEHGVQAEVEFTPIDYTCSDDWYTPDDHPLQGLSFSPPGVTDDDGRLVIEFTVDPDDFAIGGDRTVVIEVGKDVFEPKNSESEHELKAEVSRAGMEAAKGEVGDCDPVPFDPPTHELKSPDVEKRDDGSDSKNED